MNALAWLLVVLAAAPVKQPDAARASALLAKGVTKDSCWHQDEEGWKALGVPDVHELVFGQKTLDGAAVPVSKAYGLDPAAARELVLAVVLSCRGLRDISEQRDPGPVLKHFEEASRLSHGALPVVAALALDHRVAPEGEAALFRMLEASPAPAATALEVAHAGSALYGTRFALLAWAVVKDPKSLVPAAELMADEPPSSDSLPLRLELLERAGRAKDNGIDVAKLADGTLRSELSSRFIAGAATTWHSLPAQVAADLAAGKVHAVQKSYVYGPNGHEETTEPAPDLRPQVAAALFVTGDAAGAKALAPGLKAPPATTAGEAQQGDRRDACRNALQVRGVRARAGLEAVADAFALAMDVETCQDAGALTIELIAPLLPPRLARTITDRLRWRLKNPESELDRSFPPDSPVTTLVAAQVTRLRESEKADLERQKSLVQPLEQKEVAKDAVAAGIAARLQAALPPVFKEVPLPKGAKPGRTGDRAGERAPPDLKLPDGFWFVRADHAAGRFTVLALSQNLDPAGEVSGGAYYLLLSEDGGKTFPRIVYTGLREYRPYVLASSSSVPMLKGDVVQLEGAVKELDEKSITFPPVALETKRTSKPLLLRASLAALEKDSDKDGVPDLVEVRLLTDPNAPDTDGDGVNDGDDSSPLVPALPGGPRTKEGELMEAFFRFQQAAEKPPALVTGVPDEGADPVRLPKGHAPVAANAVRFLEADRAELAGVGMPITTIVVTPDEIEAVSTRFGDTYGMKVDLLVDDAGNRALIDWSEHWRGGQVKAEKKDGRWRFTVISDWIT